MATDTPTPFLMHSCSKYVICSTPPGSLRPSLSDFLFWEAERTQAFVQALIDPASTNKETLGSGFSSEKTSEGSFLQNLVLFDHLFSFKIQIIIVPGNKNCMGQEFLVRINLKFQTVFPFPSHARWESCWQLLVPPFRTGHPDAPNASLQSDAAS